MKRPHLGTARGQVRAELRGGEHFDGGAEKQDPGSDAFSAAVADAGEASLLARPPRGGGLEAGVRPLLLQARLELGGEAQAGLCGKGADVEEVAPIAFCLEGGGHPVGCILHFDGGDAFHLEEPGAAAVAVVANEVKELAKETARATEEIGQQIEAIQGDTKAAVAAIRDVSEIINQVNDISSTIASAVEEQTATTNEIGRNVTDAAKATSDIAHNISHVARATEHTKAGAVDTQSAAQALTGMAAQLQALVNRFQL